MGDEQKLGYEELLAASRAAFEEVPDFTLAVEEEFALLDPATLDLVNRFEEIQQAAKGTEVEPHLVGELIASEVEVRTGRCESFAEAFDRMGERRAQLRTLADGLGIGLSSVGTHPWSPWQEQRIIDTPHYRRNDQLLRYVVWRNNSFGLHVHVGVNGPDRAIRVCNALRNYLPELLAFSASSPFVEGVFTHLHSARTQIFTRMFPRCGIPDWFEGWDDWESYVRFLYATGSVTEHTQIWWSVRPPIRWGLSGELIDLRHGESIPARARIEQLLEWVRPVADELGVGASLAVPERNAAERQIARHAEGATMEEIFAEQVAAGERVAG